MSSFLIYRKSDGKPARVDSIDFAAFLKTGEWAATKGTNVYVSKAVAKAAANKPQTVAEAVESVVEKVKPVVVKPAVVKPVVVAPKSVVAETVVAVAKK
jgi:hypothetical protein